MLLFQTAKTFVVIPVNLVGPGDQGIQLVPNLMYEGLGFLQAVLHYDLSNQ